MPDRELENWLSQQVPPGPGSDTDARIQHAARELLAAQAVQSVSTEQPLKAATQHRCRVPRTVRNAAAAVLLMALAGWGWSVWRASQVTTTSRELAAAGGGNFTVAAGSRYQFDVGAADLLLEDGSCAARVAAEPLAVAFPGGCLEIESGAGEVTLYTDKEMIMNRTGRPWKKGAVLAVVTLAVGFGVLDFQDDQRPLAAGDVQVLLATPAADGRGGYDVEPLAAATGATELRGDQPTAPEDGESAVPSDIPPASFRGQVLDAVTGDPIAGARVGWVSQWIEQGVSGAILRGPKSTMFVTNPGTVSIGETLVPLPMWPGPMTKVRTETTSDAGGRYQLSADPASHEFLMIVADGYTPRYEKAPPAEAEDVLVSELGREWLVRGRLTTASGAPLLGDSMLASMNFRHALAAFEGWSCERTILVHDDYTFETRVAPVGELTLNALAPGYEDFSLVVSLSQVVTDVTLVLTEHPHLKGRVLDELGQPLAGASLLVKSGKRKLFGVDFNHISCVTNASGEYLANVYGPVIEVSVELDGYAPQDIKKVTAEQPFDITLVKAEKGAISGSVVDDRELPVVGAHVTVTHDGIGIIRRYKVDTDARGEFLVSELPPGKYRIEAAPAIAGTTMVVGTWGNSEPAGAIHIGVEKRGIEVASGTETRDVTLTIRQGARVVGTFLGETGAPVAGERIALYKPDLIGGDHQTLASVLTDAQGSFEFHGIPAGMYAVAVDRLGTYQVVTVRGTDAVRVDLGGETFELAGRVFRDDKPLAEAPIALGRFAEGTIDSRMDRTGLAGEFHFQGLAPGRTLVHITDPGRQQVLVTTEEIGVRSGDLEIDWPATVVTVTLTDSPVAVGTELHLKLIEVDGIPLEGKVPATYLHMATARSEDGTTFRFDGISRARYRVIGQDGERQLTSEFEVGERDRSVLIQGGGS